MICVDYNMACLPNKNWKWNTVCHLFASTKEELNDLHSVAHKIGLKREWFQDRARLPHYDLTPNKRILAIKAGAVEIYGEPLLDIFRYWREQTSPQNL